ncbi:hypothetical protein Tco_0163898 [Tanacetum coccineum]
MINTPYSINLNMMYGSAEGQYAVLILKNMPYCLEEQIRCLDCRDQYDVLSGRVDTSVPDRVEFRGIVNPKIGDDIEFEINANFMRELRHKLFAGTDDEDAYEHVRTVLEIVDLLHFPGVTHDAIMLRQKVHIFYTGLDISTRKILDSSGFIPLITPTQALESIQVMADHSHDWYDEPTTRERIDDVLDNVDAIHESFEGGHLTKEYPLKKEDETFKHSRYMESLEETIIKFCEDTIKKQTADDEKMRKILKNMESNIRALKTRTKNLQVKAYQLTHKVLTNTGEKVKEITTMGKENMKEPVRRDLPPMPFLGHLKEQMGSPYRTRKTVHMNGNPKEIHNAKAQDDERDMDVGWDITNKGVERLRQFLTPTVHTLPNWNLKVIYVFTCRDLLNIKSLNLMGISCGFYIMEKKEDEEKFMEA